MLHIYEKVHSKMSTVMITFDGGARSEEGEFSMGIAHMLEHMLFKGTAKRDCYSIQREVALLGGSTNAYTSNELVSYYITVPFENLEAAMEILSDMVWNSTLPDEEFVKEREVVSEEEAEGQADINSYNWDTFSLNFLSNRSKDPIIGTQESIKGFSVEEVKRFYNKFYDRNNAILAVSSCIGVKQAKSFMTKYFGRNTNKFYNSAKVFPENYLESKVLNLTRPVIEHAYVWMGYPGRKYADPNEAADSIMLSILGGGADSRLFETIRERNGLCYGIGAAAFQLRDQGALIINSSTRVQNIDKLISLVNDEIAKMQNGLVEDEELIRAKNQFRAQTYRLTESSGSSVRWNTGRAFFNLQNLDSVAKEVSALTREDILQSAQRFFDKDKELLMIVRPEEK
jgi:predicted Zn-dependent peptidase